MQVVILCGGRGSRLREQTETIPKPMVEIGGIPILWHIMKIYAGYGLKDFILCLGYKKAVIKDYFYNYEMLSNDFTIELGSGNIQLYPNHDEHGWRVTLADTGENAMTGARLKRIEKYISDDMFMMTYGDGVTDLNIPRLLNFHRKHGKIGTVTAVCPPSRYGELFIHDQQVKTFLEKPKATSGFISGGYFIFNREFFDYLSDRDDCVLEQKPLETLTRNGQLMVYEHDGFWQCMDTFRDYEYLNNLWEQGNPPWKTW